MKETQATIGQWTRDTFPQYLTNERRLIACLEEMVELCVAGGMKIPVLLRTVNTAIDKSIYQTDPNPREEAGDVLNCLYAFADFSGFDLHAELDKKMVTCRALPKEHFEKKVAMKKSMGMFEETVEP